MKIRENMLAALASLKTAEDVLGKPAIQSAKKTWWDNVRGEYNLDPATKYKVELHGELAGELRFKANGEPVPANDGVFIVVFADSHTRYPSADAALAAATERGERVAQLVG